MERLFRPRLVVPSQYARRWADEGHVIELSPGGRLAFVELVTDEHGLGPVLEAMTQVSADWLRQNPGAPSILNVARYEREPKGENDYLALPVSLGRYNAEYTRATGHRPYVDCEDLEIGVSAERRVHLGDTGAHPEPTRTGEAMWHIRTRFGDGRVQDSTRLQLARQGHPPWNL